MTAITPHAPVPSHVRLRGTGPGWLVGLALVLGVTAGVGSARPALVVLTAGLAAAVVLAAATARAGGSDGRVWDEPVLAELTLAPVVATVPSCRFRARRGRRGRLGRRGRRSHPLEVCDFPASAGTGMFHAVGAALRRPPDNGPVVVVVTSPSRTERRESFAANLAAAIAQQGRKVVLVDGRLRAPHHHELTDVALTPGLAETLEPRPSPVTTHPSPLERGLSVVPAGGGIEDPESALASSRFGTVVRQLATSHDVVVVDLPGCLADSAAKAASAADVIVLVSELGRTRCRDARRAADVLRTATDATIVSVLSAPRRRPILGRP